MNQTIDILYGRTPILFYDAPEGRPSAVDAIEIYENTDDDTGTNEGSSALGSTAVETNPNTTVDAASGLGQADPRIVYLTATTGIELGRRYLLTSNSGSGPAEWVDVIAIDSGNSVTARHPLVNAYASGSTFASTRLQATFTSAWTSDLTNLSDSLDPNPRWRALFQYRVGSSERYTAYVYFDVVRWRVTTNVTGPDVDAAYPGWLKTLPTQYLPEQGAPIIRDALRQVRVDLYAERLADQMARNSEIVDALCIWKAVEIAETAKMLYGNGRAEALELAKQIYATQFARLISGKTVIPFATDSGGAAEPKIAQTFTVR